MMLSKERIEANKQQIVELLQSTNRKGMNKVLAYLDGVGFYTAPSSRDRHHNWRGGLAQHSLETCRLALADRGSVARESVIIAALLHDICKYGEGDEMDKSTYTDHALNGAVYVDKMWGMYHSTYEERNENDQPKLLCFGYS